MSLIALLGEDRAHLLFARHVLQELGIARSRIRDLKIPAGKGDGISHVLHNYPQEVQAYRSVAGYQESAGLVALRDADNHEVEQTQAEFDEALRAAQMEVRGKEERICLLIPKRAIETWIHYLLGYSVNEDDSYKNAVELGQIKAAAKQLVELRAGKKPPIETPRSLSEALRELQRILK